MRDWKSSRACSKDEGGTLTRDWGELADKSGSGKDEGHWVFYRSKCGFGISESFAKRSPIGSRLNFKDSVDGKVVDWPIIWGYG